MTLAKKVDRTVLVHLSGEHHIRYLSATHEKIRAARFSKLVFPKYTNRNPWIRDHLRERILQDPRFFLGETFLLSSTKKCFPPEKILDPAKADRASSPLEVSLSNRHQNLD